MIRCP